MAPTKIIGTECDVCVLSTFALHPLLPAAALAAAPWARTTKNVRKPQNQMCESCRKAWFKIFVKQNRNIFGFSNTFLFWGLLLYKISFKKQTNEINHINDNHIKFEVSLHFRGIWSTVRRRYPVPLRLPGLAVRPCLHRSSTITKAFKTIEYNKCKQEPPKYGFYAAFYLDHMYGFFKVPT
jgi:hypothetical protein